MIFEYKAATKEGKIISSKMEAASEAEVVNFLKKQELLPILIKKKPSFLKGISLRTIFSRRISLEDKLFLTKYLALMLRVGTDLLEALETLEKDLENPAIKEFLFRTRENLRKGRPFYESFEAYPKDFSQTFVALIKAGETSGKLEEVCQILSQATEREADLKRKLKSALTYPIILIVASIIVISILLTFAIPRIASIFEGMEKQPPLFTRVVFGLSNFLRHYGLFLLILIIGALAGLWIFYTRTLAGRKFFQNLLTHLPFVKKVVKKLDIQRFTQNFSAMLEAGVPITQALEISIETLNSLEIKEALKRVAYKIKSGKTIGDAFLEEGGVFPSVLVSLIAIGEKAGHLSESLKSLSNFYAGEIDATIKSLMSLIEPVILLFIGIIIASIAVGVIVPMYQMVSGVAQ